VNEVVCTAWRGIGGGEGTDSTRPSGGGVVAGGGRRVLRSLPSRYGLEWRTENYGIERRLSFSFSRRAEGRA